MAKPTFTPTKGVVCVELELGLIDHEAHGARITVSIPGREGSVERLWTMRSRGVDTSTWTDMYHWALMALRNGLAVSYGIQEDFSEALGSPAP